VLIIEKHTARSLDGWLAAGAEKSGGAHMHTRAFLLSRLNFHVNEKLAERDMGGKFRERKIFSFSVDWSACIKGSIWDFGGSTHTHAECLSHSPSALLRGEKTREKERDSE
jgi:hypothetical protein